MYYRLEINNFRGIKQKIIENEFPVLLFQKNGYGKTSTIEAFRYVLTGKYANSIIRKGCSEGSVILDIGDIEPISIRRVFSKSGTTCYLNGKKTTAKTLNEVIRKKFNDVTDLQLDAVTSLETFNNLMKGDIGKFIFSVIDTSITYEEILSLVELSEGAKKMLCEKMPSSITPEGINEKYKELFEERAIAKKELKRLGEVSEPNFPEHLTSLEDVKRYSSEYYAFAEKRKSREKEQSRYIAELENFNQAQDKILQLKEKAKSLCTVKPVTSLETIKEQFNKTQNEINECEKSISAIKENTNFSQKVISKLSDTLCPISKKIICTTDKSPLKKELEETIKINFEKVERIHKNLSELATKKAMIEKDIENYKKELNEYNLFLSITENITNLELIKKPTIPIETADLTFDFDFEKELLLYNKCITDSEKYKNCERLKEEIQILEELTSVFASKGLLTTSIFDRYLSILNETANHYGEMLGYSVYFVCDDCIQVMAKPSEKSTFVNYFDLSKGEQLLVSIIVYSIINKLLDVGILFVDNINDLDQDNKKKLEGFIANYGDEYNIIVLAGTE